MAFKAYEEFINWCLDGDNCCCFNPLKIILSYKSQICVYLIDVLTREKRSEFETIKLNRVVSSQIKTVGDVIHSIVMGKCSETSVVRDGL